MVDPLHAGGTKVRVAGLRLPFGDGGNGMLTTAGYARRGRYDPERSRMVEDWLNERDSFDTLRVPFVFVPEGATAPAEWRADHPHHIRVPATFVPPRRVSEPRRDRSSPVVATSGNGATGGVSGSFAPVGVRNRRRWPPPPEIDRSGYLRETPMAAYLRANEMFVRLGVVGLGARPDKAPLLDALDTGSAASGDNASLEKTDRSELSVACAQLAVDPPPPVEPTSGHAAKEHLSPTLGSR